MFIKTLIASKRAVSISDGSLQNGPTWTLLWQGLDRAVLGVILHPLPCA